MMQKIPPNTWEEENVFIIEDDREPSLELDNKLIELEKDGWTIKHIDSCDMLSPSSHRYQKYNIFAHRWVTSKFK